MTESNADIRANLIKYLTLFNERNCQYNFQEREIVITALQRIKPVNEGAEDFNSRHPQHGLSPKTEKWN